MDLFVVNRYQDSSEQVDLSEQENKQLQKLKERIEERKRASRKKRDQVITLKPLQPEPQTAAQEVENDDKVDVGKEEVIEENDESLKEETVKPAKGKPTTEFKVLGISDFEKKTKVHRILPYWLSHPYAISTKLQNLSFVVDEQAWLNKTLKSTLISEGVRYLFPVQEVVIPFIFREHAAPHPFRPHDICVSAPTGSGKTLSFVLPIVQILMNEIGHHIRALIVLPVQELATQVAKVFKKYCTGTGLKVALLSGSTPLQQEQQQIVRYTESAQWVSEVDIIVCTAGRLVEHLQNTEGFSLKHLKFLVIDEADRIMDYIQNDWLYHMDRHIKLENELMNGKATSLNWNNISNQKSPPHKLLFSATLSQDPEKLEQWGLFQPKLFSAVSTNIYEDEDQIRKYTTPEELVEKFITCNPEEKPLVLFHFLVGLKWDKVLCFTNAAQSAHRLTTLLNIWAEGQFKAAELSSALDRATRESVLKKFTNGEINILIGTDALARGIDIPDCDFVISYDPPRNIKTYIHRIGRTGRAGRNGQAVTILLQNQEVLFKELINSGGKSDLPQIEINSEIYSNLSKSYMNAIQQTKLHIHEEQSSKVKKSIELKRNSKLKSRKRKHEQTQ